MGAFLNALGSAANAGIYAYDHRPLPLACAVLNGLVCLICIGADA